MDTAIVGLAGQASAREDPSYCPPTALLPSLDRTATNLFRFSYPSTYI